jgi:MADS-box transcription factor, plant
MGEDLDSLEFDELRGLEQNVDVALKEVRHRKARTKALTFSSAGS